MKKSKTPKVRAFDQFKCDFFEEFGRNIGVQENYRVSPDLILRVGVREPKVNRIVPPPLSLSIG